MVVTRRIKIIHARGYLAAMMGLIIKKIFGTKLIFDPRDLFLEYKIFEGFLSKSSLKFKISSQLEKTLFNSADAIIVTSEKFRERLESLSYLPIEKIQKVRVVPNCVDTNAFIFSPEDRQQIRKSLGLCGKIVLIYAGNIGRVRCLKEMSEFVHVMETRVNNLHTLFLTYNNLEEARSRLRECGWSDGALTLSGISPSKMPGVLSAADVGFGFFDLTYAAIASPIKFAEYLACGLPVIINQGVGDTDRIIEKYHAGAIVREWHKDGYYRAVGELLKLLEERDKLRERCRSAAEHELSLDCAVERLSDLYRSLLVS
jgi:glycosyltransferase involved in cell wall biosynthesis